MTNIEMSGIGNYVNPNVGLVLRGVDRDQIKNLLKNGPVIIRKVSHDA